MEPLDTDTVTTTIGIPPAIAPPVRKTISGRQYSCLVNEAGVQFRDETNDRTTYLAYIDGYLPLLTPKLTKAGKFAVRQPQITKQSLKWWKAQCGFRGLPVGGKLQDLQDRIRKDGKRGMSEAMKEACDEMERDYVTNNDRAIQEIWIRGDDNEKVKVWPERLLHELLKSRPDRETLVVEVDDWGNKIESVASQMKVHCEIRKMPDYQTGQRLVVLGLNEQSVRSKMAEFDRDIQRAVQREKQEQQESQDDFDRRFRLAQSKGKGSKGEWNVTGQWEISCPYMEEQWGSGDDGCSLEIGITKPNGTGLVEMYASFDFIAITGIMRFINPSAQNTAQEEGSKARSQKDHGADESNDESGDEFDDSDTSDNTDEGRTPPNFLFPPTSLPSTRNSSFSFRWRGEETGESEIQLYSDEKLCSLKFESPNALSGTFISDLTSEITFRGIKQESSGRRERKGWYDPGHEWHSRNGVAYERARVGRWH